MKLTFALLARYAEIDPESGLLNVTGGGIDVFGVKHLPASFPMPFVLQFRYPEAEAGQAFTITMGTFDSALELVGEQTDFEITPNLGEYHAEGSHGIYAVAGTVQLAVESVGAHSMWIEVDGSVAGDIPFQVFLSDEQ